MKYVYFIKIGDKENPATERDCALLREILQTHYGIESIVTDSDMELQGYMNIENKPWWRFWK